MRLETGTGGQGRGARRAPADPRGRHDLPEMLEGPPVDRRVLAAGFLLAATLGGLSAARPAGAAWP